MHGAIDTVNYQFNFQPAGTVLTVDLGAGTSSEILTSPLAPIPGVPTQTFTASDTLINIENVSGTIGVDVIYGNAGDNVLQGFLGDDRLRGGAGNDTLDGNVFTLFTHLENTGPSPLDGSDTADYATDPNGVVVNLATGVATADTINMTAIPTSISISVNPLCLFIATRPVLLLVLSAVAAAVPLPLAEVRPAMSTAVRGRRRS